jgi:hypothetical protein
MMIQVHYELNFLIDEISISTEFLKQHNSIVYFTIELKRKA